MSNVFINRTASFLPFAPVGNEEMEAALGRTGSRPSRSRRITLRSNGIKSRHYVVDPATGEVRYSNAQLAAEAVRRLTGDGFQLENLTCLSAGTSIPDQIVPGHGVMVHGELGGQPCEVLTAAGVCAAGAMALKYAWLAVRSGEHASAVATGSEAVSLALRATRYAAETEQQGNDLEAHPELAFEKDFLRWMLSDGAGALLLQSAPNPSGLSLRIDWIDAASYANEMPVCMYAGAEKDANGALLGWARFNHDELGKRSVLAIKQDVRLLNENIVRYCIEKPLSAIVKRRGLKPEDVDWFLPHLSSEYFRPATAKGLNDVGFVIPAERWFTNLSTRGNTGAASIYIMLDELFRSGQLRKGQRLLCLVPESGRFTSVYFHLTVVDGQGASS